MTILARFAAFTRPGETTPARHRAAIVLVSVGAIGVSLGGLIVRHLESASAWQFNIYRGLVGAISLSVILVAQYRGGALEQFRRMESPAWFGAGALGLAAVFYILSLVHTTVANTQFVMSAAPFVVAALAWLVLGERPARATVAAMAVAFIGIGLMVWDGLAVGHVYGGMLALMTVALFSSYGVITRGLRDLNMLPAVIVASCVTMVAGGLGSLGDFQVSVHDLWLCVVWGLIVAVCGDWFFVIAVRHLAVAETTLLLMMIPSVFGPFWVWLIIDEVPSNATLAGGTLVLAAVAGWALRDLLRER